MKAIVGRSKDGKPRKANYCGSCRIRLWRERHPAAYAFRNLKNRAKQRGKEFKITLAEFKAWCEKTGYHLLKGKHADGMSVDRIREDGPYSIENIQMIPLGQNSKKNHLSRGHVVGEIDPSKPYTAEDHPWL